MRTPFLISLKYPRFEDYLKVLSKNTRTEIRGIFKKNSDLNFEPIPYNRSLVLYFMRLWEKQTVYGHSVDWQFGIGFVEFLQRKDKMLFYGARCKITGEILCILFVEVHSRLIEAHPPLYDKDLYSSREIAKFMNVNLFKYLIEARDYDWVDINAGVGRSWKDIVSDFRNGRNKSYKWIYVPNEIKKGLTNEKSFRIFINLSTFEKTMKIDEKYKFNYVESLKMEMIKFFFWWKGERLKRIKAKIGIIKKV